MVKLSPNSCETLFECRNSAVVIISCTPTMSYRRQSNRQVKPIERFGDVSPHKEDEIYEEDQV